LPGIQGLYIVQASQRSATARMAKSVDARDLKEVVNAGKAIQINDLQFFDSGI
jgi:hypothetical protein